MGSKTDFISFEQGLISTLAGIRHVLSTHDSCSHTKCPPLPVVPVCVCVFECFHRLHPTTWRRDFLRASVVCGLLLPGWDVQGHVWMRGRECTVWASKYTAILLLHTQYVWRYLCVKRLYLNTSEMSCSVIVKDYLLPLNSCFHWHPETLPELGQHLKLVWLSGVPLPSSGSSDKVLWSTRLALDI